VRVLLDESLPRQLASELSEFDVRTVSQQNWSGLSNGELLRKAEANGFDVFVTADQNLRYQQSLSKSILGVVVIVARSNRIQDLKPLIPEIKDGIKTVNQGQIKLVGG
jgi:hypothetical protein